MQEYMKRVRLLRREIGKLRPIEYSVERAEHLIKKFDNNFNE